MNRVPSGRACAKRRISLLSGTTHARPPGAATARVALLP
jgi:hypothetical protein